MSASVKATIDSDSFVPFTKVDVLFQVDISILLGVCHEVFLAVDVVIRGRILHIEIEVKTCVCHTVIGSKFEN